MYEKAPICSETYPRPQKRKQSHTICCAVSNSPVLARGNSEEQQFFKAEIPEVRVLKTQVPPMVLVGEEVEGFG